MQKRSTIEAFAAIICMTGMCLISGLVGYRLAAEFTSVKYEKTIHDIEESHRQTCSYYIETTHGLLEEIEELKGIENPIDYDEYDYDYE